MPLFMWDFGPQIILDKVLQLFSTKYVLYSFEYPYVPNCKVVVKTSSWWEWDLGGRSKLFLCKRNHCYSGAVKDRVKQEQMCL